MPEPAAVAPAAGGADGRFDGRTRKTGRSKRLRRLRREPDRPGHGAPELRVREVIALRHFADLSYEEMADAIGVPEKTVKSRLFSARQKLAGLLGVAGDANDGSASNDHREDAGLDS
jgi:RNA polymerase sigma-70 factor (ECF subfamily)